MEKEEGLTIKFILFILISSLLLANQYPSFSQNELSSIEQKSGRIAKNRILDYEKNIAIIQKYSKKKQLGKVNFYLNQLLPQYDDVINKQEDHWATPKEFLITGYGDCEDYVIIKYFTLINLGFDEKKLYITVVKEGFYGGYHMVLTYFKAENKPPLVLDNLSFRILDLDTRSDLKADVFINSSGVFKLQNKRLVKIADYNREYKNLLKAIAKEN